MKICNFWGDVFEISAKKAALVLANTLTFTHLLKTVNIRTKRWFFLYPNRKLGNIEIVLSNVVSKLGTAANSHTIFLIRVWMFSVPQYAHRLTVIHGVPVFLF